MNAKLISGWRAELIRIKVRSFIVRVALNQYRSPIRAMREMKKLVQLRSKVNGSISILKFIKSGDQFFWNADYCGYPSENLRTLLHKEFKRNQQQVADGLNNTQGLQTLIWGITNRCPLSCQHCYEWDNIALADKLDLVSLKKILTIFRENGLRHIQFSGGEPLSRFNDLIELTKEASPDMDCWILTSGFGLSADKALALKKAGLRGAQISLDHWDAEQHNNFRNNNRSYEMATDAARNCLNAGIMVSFSLCATREFVSENNLMKYANLAKGLGVNFIRILEPRAVGKFSNVKVALATEQVELLSDFAKRLNADKHYKDYPIVTFFGYHQREMGCFGAGERYVYIDPNGDVHACPFCRGRMGNLLEESFTGIIERVKTVGCHLFDNHENEL
jgi:MoaA/NifB/PqqE/SkfB family radical SAM enzyme